jgi:uncharacterized protein involved in exopolysaccharide biosynthesis
MEEGYQPFEMSSLRDILAILFKHKYKILITFLIVSIGVSIYALGLRRAYEAKSMVLVKFGREFMTRPEAGAGGGNFAVPPQQIISGEVSILTSRDLLRKVVTDIGPETLYPGLAKMQSASVNPVESSVRLFEESVVVRNVAGSSLIEVSFTHPNPEVAAKAVNLLVDLFKEKHLEVFSGDSTPFLKNQQKVFRERLRESEEKLSDFKQRNRMVSLEDQRAGLIAQRNTLDTNLKTIQVQVVEAEQKVALIKSQRGTADAPSELRTQLLALQQKERELAEKYTDSSRIVQNLRHEIQVTKDSIGRYAEDSRQAELKKLEGDLSILKARADSVRRQLSQTEGEVYSLESRGPQLQELRRELAQQEQNFQTYSKKLEESLIMDDMDRQKMVNISVVEKATASALPKQGRLGKRQLIPIGLLGGIVLGIALAFLLEAVTPTMTTPWSAERRLDLPVMVAIGRRD